MSDVSHCGVTSPRPARAAMSATVLAERLDPRADGLTESPRSSSAHFALGVVGIAILGATLRFSYVFASRNRAPATDAFFYLLNSRFIAHGHGFRSYPGSGPSAFHPPAWPALLAIADVLGHSGILAHQVLACIVGTATVVLVALAGREVAGVRVGIIAAAIAAVYPNIWIWEREIAAETLIMPLVALLILLAYRCHAKPRLISVAALGAVSAVLALTRGEQVLLLVVLVIPLVLLCQRASLRRAALYIGTSCVAAAVVFAPWFVYNASRFDRRVLIATDFGPTVRLSNDDFTFHGPWLGSLDVSRWTESSPVPGGDESVEDNASIRAGMRYARHHLSRVPVVVAAREGRTWDVFAPFQQAQLDESWGHDPSWLYRLGIVSYWLLLPAAVAGVVVLRRRRRFLLPLLAPFAVAAIATVVTYGEPRLRACAEVPLVLLAAVGIDAAIRAASGRTRTPCIRDTRRRFTRPRTRAAVVSE